MVEAIYLLAVLCCSIVHHHSELKLQSCSRLLMSYQPIMIFALVQRFITSKAFDKSGNLIDIRQLSHARVTTMASIVSAAEFPDYTT